MNELDTIKQAAKAVTENKRNQGYQSTGLHQYTDTEDNILYVRLRMEDANGDKWIRPLSRDVEGNWTLLKEPTFAEGKPLYNLHLLAKYPDQTVFFVEGEKCADALVKLGLLATTSGGASSAKDANYQILSGREVTIWSDNDKAGLQYAIDVRAKLTSENATIKEIDIDLLNLPAKGDCVDWLQKFDKFHGHNARKEDIEALPHKADTYNEPASVLKDVGDTSISTQSDDADIKDLAMLKPIDYDRVRVQKAKAMKVQVKTLDDLVKIERKAISQDNDSPFSDIEPWYEPINPAQLLDEITQTIQRFIVLDKIQAQTASLWISACWFINVIICAPIALINAPEKACGKTLLLTILARLAPRAVQASSISPSVLFRMIEAHQPTLFIDEIETLLKDNEDLRGLINAGHTRDSAYVWRSVARGDDFEPKRFTVWGMKAIAGINAIKLAETVTSRSIVFELRRRTAGEKVERFRHAETGLFEVLARKLARFSEDYASEVQLARPYLPDELGDREQDNFEPLLQIASVAGGQWLDTALKAALTLSGASQSTQSSANELLTDIQEIFQSKGVIKITSNELITALCADAELSWATYNRGNQLSPRQLATKLKPYGIASKDIRFGYEGVKKGYEAEQFNDAFERYISLLPENTLLSATPLQPNNDVVLNVAVVKNLPATCNISATLEPLQNMAGSVVADITPILGGITKASKDEAMRF